MLCRYGTHDYWARPVNQKFERPVTAQAAVLTELRQRIIRGDLQPGQPIRQEVLASELGVSRLPVREALVVLQSERLVDYTQHKGYVATTLDPVDLAQTYRLRDILESEAVDQAVPNLTDDDVAAMRKLLVEMERENSNLSAVLEMNRDFHFLLFSKSRNLRLVSLLRQLWDTCDRYRAIYFSTPTSLDRAHREHEEIVEASAARDADRIRDLLSEHREGGLSQTMAVLEAQNDRVARSAPQPTA